MDLLLEDKPKEELKEKTFIQQTSFWSNLKEKQGLSSQTFSISAKNQSLFPKNTPGTQQDDLLVLIQKINTHDSIAYVPYGPYIETADENKGPFLEALSECLAEKLPKSCILIRFDLVWESDWAKETDFYTKEKEWVGPPEHRIQEMRINFNTKNWNLKKSPTDILPSNTLLINVQKEQDTLLRKMKPKTRYNIRLAGRKEVVVKEKNSINNLETWLQLYQETASRNGINYQNPEYFKQVLETNKKHTSSNAEIKLLIAEHDDEPLAAMFLAITENRATYLYGASSNKKRNLMAPYALQWEAINIAKKNGCKEYDLFGVSPSSSTSHPLQGLFRFKTGFGGSLFHRMGCWDYPLNKEKYQHLVSFELNQAGYHL